MARLRTYDNRALPTQKTVRSDAIAGRAQSQQRATAAAGRLGSAMALWMDEFKDREAAGIATSIDANAQAQWDEIKTQATRDGYYTVDGDQHDLVEGEKIAFQKWSSLVGESIAQIENKRAREAAQAEFADRSEAMMIQINQDLRQNLEERAIQRGIETIQVAAAARNYDLVDKAYENLVNDGFMSGEKAADDKAAIKADAELNYWRKRITTMDDDLLDEFALDVFDNAWMTPEQKDRISAEAMQLSDDRAKEQDNALNAAYQANEQKLFMGKDWSEITREDVINANLSPEATLEYVKQLSKREDAGDNPDDLAAANRALSDLIQGTSSVQETTEELAALELSDATRNKFIRDIHSTSENLMTNPTFSRQVATGARQVGAGFMPDQFELIFAGDLAREFGQLVVAYEAEMNREFLTDPANWTYEKGEAITARYYKQTQALQDQLNSGSKDAAGSDDQTAREILNRNGGDFEAATAEINRDMGVDSTVHQALQRIRKQ